MTTTLKRGQKKCSKCGEINGARSYECKNCHSEFLIRKKRKKKRVLPIEDWGGLEPGTLVKVCSGSGPYYVDEKGEKHFFTEKGIYRVFKVDIEGLHCYNDQGGSYSFIYMGPEREGLVSSMRKAPHKLILVNR